MNKRRKPKDNELATSSKGEVNGKDEKHKIDLAHIPPVEPNDRKSNRKSSGSDGESKLERGSNH